MWRVTAKYGTGNVHSYAKPTRESARLLKVRLEKQARLSGVPYDVRISR